MIIGTLFFLMILTAAMTVLYSTIGEHLDDILAALEHDSSAMEVRASGRPRQLPGAPQLAAAA